MKSDNQIKTSEEKTVKEKTPDKSSSSTGTKQVLKQQLLKELRAAKDDKAKEAIQEVLTLAGFPKPSKKVKKRCQTQTKDDESGKDLNDLDKAAIKQKFDEDLKPKKSKKKKSKKSDV
jgi:hypothetical protein